MKITLNMKGDIKQIIYVDRYTHNSNYRKRLNSFSDAINELIPGALFDIVTAHTPYTQHHENQEQKSVEFKTKLLQKGKLRLKKNKLFWEHRKTSKNYSFEP